MATFSVVVAERASPVGEDAKSEPDQDQDSTTRLRVFTGNPAISITNGLCFSRSALTTYRLSHFTLRHRHHPTHLTQLWSRIQHDHTGTVRLFRDPKQPVDSLETAGGSSSSGGSSLSEEPVSKLAGESVRISPLALLALAISPVPYYSLTRFLTDPFTR